MAKKTEEIGILKTRISELQDKLHTVRDKTTTLIEDNPTRSVLIGVGVGILIGAIIASAINSRR